MQSSVSQGLSLLPQNHLQCARNASVRAWETASTIASFVSPQLRMLPACNLPLCRSPILMVGIRNAGASIIPLEEFPSTKIKDFLDAIKCFPGIEFIATKSNADLGGANINALLEEAGGKIKTILPHLHHPPPAPLVCDKMEVRHLRNRMPDPLIHCTYQSPAGI